MGNTPYVALSSGCMKSLLVMNENGCIYNIKHGGFMLSSSVHNVVISDIMSNLAATECATYVV